MGPPEERSEQETAGGEPPSSDADGASTPTTTTRRRLLLAGAAAAATGAVGLAVWRRSDQSATTQPKDVPLPEALALAKVRQAAVLQRVPPTSDLLARAVAFPAAAIGETGYRPRLGDDVTVDARLWRPTVDRTNYPAIVGGFRNAWIGGAVDCRPYDDADTWHDIKRSNDGCALLFKDDRPAARQPVDEALDWAVVDGLRSAHSFDFVRPARAPWMRMTNCWAQRVRDDVIENDVVCAGGVIRDCLIEGAFGFLSEQQPSPSGGRLLEIDHCVVGLAPQPYRTDEARPPGSVVDGRAHNVLWKFRSTEREPASNWTHLWVHDCVFFMPQVPVDAANKRALRWPGGGLDDGPPGLYENNVFVYTGTEPYGVELPAGVRLTDDVALYDDAVRDWKRRHGAVDMDTVDMDAMLDPAPFTW